MVGDKDLNHDSGTAVIAGRIERSMGSGSWWLGADWSAAFEELRQQVPRQTNRSTPSSTPPFPSSK